MGIKGFRSWFESQFPNAMHSIPKSTAHDRFDHVLIDMNQLLHVCLRKSKSEGHALTLLMKELDECCRMATPTQSLVLAMDGPPSASKLATQRQRRLQTIVRTDRKLLQMEQLSQTGKRVFSKNKRAKKRWRYQADTRTLRITPGTDFMVRTEQAILYWAWQRLQNNNPHHFLSKVKVYVSPSTVAGEGEVKLLEWILRQPSISHHHHGHPSGQHGSFQGESIAILGGDSDLVLEGLVIPPAFSHNVFVLLPDGSQKYLSVSLWETTRALAKFLPQEMPSSHYLRVRTDLVLLLILNGNDYFPKLRGSGGFHKVFHAYLRTLREWLAASDSDPAHHPPPFLVEPESLTYNLPFCIAFFRRLEKQAPPDLWWDNKINNGKRNSTSSSAAAATGRDTPLAKFNGLVDAGFFPRPIRWKVVEVKDDDGGDEEEEADDIDNVLDDEDDIDDDEMEEEEDDMDDDDDIEDEEDDDEDDIDDDDDDDEEMGEEEEGGAKKKRQLVTLRIGKPGTEDFVSYEIYTPVRKTSKKARHKLANMALEDLFGDLGDYFEKMESLDGASADSYAWEIGQAAEGKPEIYLGGLLWNLQTYQDGVCPDYSFNYGKRMSPTAGEIVKFFKQAQEDHCELGLHQLLASNNSGTTGKSPADTYPISAGVSCLAALPSQIRDLVPEPYRQLDNETVESFFGDCMDPDTNVFDLKRFERLCDEEVAKLGQGANKKSGSSKKPIPTEEEKMDMSHYWLVLAKSKAPLSNPFDPPPPFSDRLSELRPNNRISVKRLKAVWQPRQRAVWEEVDNQESQVRLKKTSKKVVQRNEREQTRLNLSQPDTFLSKFDSLDKVKFKKAYQREQKPKKKTRAVTTIEISNELNGVNQNGSTDKRKKKRKPIGVTERMLNNEHKPPPKKYATTIDGQSALACLKQFHDAGLIGEIEWTSTMPSPSEYASFNPEEHELVSLTVKPGTDSEHNILNEVLNYEQDRDINHVSRQALKQHLGTFALCDIVGPGIRWTTMTYKDLCLHLTPRDNIIAE